MHDTGKVILDLAVALAVGGDCPADVAVLRGQPRGFGAVASDPTVSRRIDALAGDVGKAAAAIRSARAQARALRLKWAPLPNNGALPVDIDATILIAHSDKENATPTYKRTFGHAPLLAYLDHVAGGTGEPLAVMLRPGRATANNAAHNIAVLREVLTQLPEADRDPGAGAHRCRRRHPCLPGGRHRAGLGVLGRVRRHRAGRRRGPRPARMGLDPGL